MVFVKIHWKKFFIFASLAYVIWVISVGGNDFGRVHREYARAVQNFDQSLIRDSARRQILAVCRESLDTKTESMASCLEQLTPERKQKEISIREERLKRKQQALKKLLLFYLFFMLIFVMLPPAIIYWTILIFSKIIAEIRIHK